MPTTGTSSATRAPDAVSSRRLSLTVQYADGAGDLPDRAACRRFVRAAIDRPAVITLRFSAEIEARELNRTYRGRDHATNVLSFSYDEHRSVAVVHGDIVVCPAVVRREAALQARPVPAHYAHLIVHGVLHLCGHDHETEDEAREMEMRETRILGKLGFADPY